MRRLTAVLLIATIAALTATTPALAQTKPQQKAAPLPPVHGAIKTTRSVLGGDEVVLATLWQVDANCVSTTPPTVRIRKDPKGGTLTVREARNAFTNDQAREICGKRKVEAIELVYKAGENFAGTDRPEIDLGYRNGLTRKVTFAIGVRKMPANAREAVIESPETAVRFSTFSGNRIMLGHLFEYGRNCEPLPPPAARVVKDASGGTLTFKESKAAPLSKQARERCKGKTFEAVEVSYQSRPDFSGTESVEIEIAFQAGKTRKASFTIEVRGAPAGAREIKVEDQPREQNFKRQVFSGNEVRIASPNNVRPDCSTGEIVDIRVVNAPSNGDLRFDTIKMPVSRGANNSRGYCNGKEIEARAVFYKPKDGFTGDDRFTIDVDFRIGKIERYSYDMRVR